MKSHLSKLVLLIYILALSSLQASDNNSYVTVDIKRMISIKEMITDDNTSYHIKRLREIAPDKKELPIYLYINSPGGYVRAGTQFISEMERIKASQGQRFVCIVDQLAASMAFQYLMYCDAIYAFRQSQLLWHPVRVQLMFATFTPKEAASLATRLQLTEAALLPPLIQRLIKVLPMDSIRLHYELETLHYATTLNTQTKGKFLTLIDFITNQSAVNTEITKQTSEIPNTSMFGFSNLMPENDIIYIHPRFIQ